MNTREVTQLIEGIINLLKLLLGIQVIIFIAWLTQFISNLTIITQLPKIKRHLKSIDEELYNLTNIEEIGKVEEISTQSNNSDIENERLKALKLIYKSKNKTDEILDSLKDYKKSDIKLDKETVEYIILGILIVIIVVLIFINFR